MKIRIAQLTSGSPADMLGKIGFGLWREFTVRGIEVYAFEGTQEWSEEVQDFVPSKVIHYVPEVAQWMMPGTQVAYFYAHPTLFRGFGWIKVYSRIWRFLHDYS